MPGAAAPGAAAPGTVAPGGGAGGGGAPDAALLARLLGLAPHVVAEARPGGALVWVDGRGLPARRLARAVLEAARAAGLDGARVGVAATPLAAEVAARWGVAAGPGTGAARRAPAWPRGRSAPSSPTMRSPWCSTAAGPGTAAQLPAHTPARTVGRTPPGGRA
jgi:hypothetical protein